MAVELDQVFALHATGGTSLAVVSVAPAGSDRLLVVHWGISGTNGQRTITSLTKGATSITDESWEEGNPTYISGGARTLTNPTTDSETVTLTWNSTADAAHVTCITFTGVDQTTPVDSATISEEDNYDPAALSISSAVGDMVTGNISCGWDDGLTFEGDGTSRTLATVGNYFAYGTATAPGAGSVSVEWGAGSGFQTASVMGGFNIKAAVAGIPNPLRPRFPNQAVQRASYY